MTSDDIGRLRPDSRNANKGTVRGRALLEDSLRRYGAGRSILADKHGVVIAGNKTLEAAADIGLPVRFVETDGSELVVVQRRDLDLDSDAAARELAYADNRVAALDLDWDVEQILEDREAGIDLGAVGFSDVELAELLSEPLPDFDPSAEWRGMPAFEQEDKTPVLRLTVNFATEADYLAFGELVGQKIAATTKWIWFPPLNEGRVVYENED